MINDDPKFLTNDPTPHTHDIVISIKYSYAENENLIFPLIMNDGTSYLPVHNPTKEEWESKTYLWLKLKSEHLDWYPASTQYT